MTYTLTTSKGTFLFVGVTSDCKNPKIVTSARHKYTIDLLNSSILYDHKGHAGFEHLDGYPISKLDYIGQLSTLTEDQAREVVDHDKGEWGEIMHRDYSSKETVWYDERFSAIDSLRSLMQAERLYTSNIYTQPDADSSKEHTDAYNEMQSRTFPDWLIIKVK